MQLCAKYLAMRPPLYQIVFQVKVSIKPKVLSKRLGHGVPPHDCEASNSVHQPWAIPSLLCNHGSHSLLWHHGDHKALALRPDQMGSEEWIQAAAMLRANAAYLLKHFLAERGSGAAAALSGHVLTNLTRLCKVMKAA
eukprot:scaffold280718_cov33-Tisochrysis_lutea.AAC.2